jgi:branched-chain amino acid aminotransferase
MRCFFIAGTDCTLGMQPSESARLLVLLSPVHSPYMPLDQGPATLLCDPGAVRAWRGGCGYTKMGANYAPSLLPQRTAESLGCVQVNPAYMLFIAFKLTGKKL